MGAALDRGDLAAAADSADRARSLDPLSLEPLFARARVEERRGDDAGGARGLPGGRRGSSRRTRRPGYELGLFEFDRGDRCSAYVHLNEAYTLDPAGKQWIAGGPLDQALDWVNAGNCSS